MREIRKFLYCRWISLRNPNLDFVDFLFSVRFGVQKKDAQNCSREQCSFFLLIMCARASPISSQVRVDETCRYMRVDEGKRMPMDVDESK